MDREQELFFERKLLELTKKLAEGEDAEKVHNELREVKRQMAIVRTFGTLH